MAVVSISSSSKIEQPSKLPTMSSASCDSLSHAMEVMREAAPGPTMGGEVFLSLALLLLMLGLPPPRGLEAADGGGSSGTWTARSLLMVSTRPTKNRVWAW